MALTVVKGALAFQAMGAGEDRMGWLPSEVPSKRVFFFLFLSILTNFLLYISLFIPSFLMDGMIDRVTFFF